MQVKGHVLKIVEIFIGVLRSYGGYSSWRIWT